MRDEESRTSLSLSTGENHVQPDAGGRPYAASPRAATGEREDDRLLTIQQVAAMLHVPVSWVMEGHAHVLRNDCLAFVLENTGGFKRKKSTGGLRVSAEAIVLSDNRATLVTDIGKGRRANLRMERTRMARSQYQNGCLFIRGKRRKVWVARWREDVILADGSADRVMRSVVLGPVSEIAGRREARRLLDAHLTPLRRAVPSRGHDAVFAIHRALL